jgi:O-acetyl-ADP-ribose deacetylase (regulator of RNase III)
MSPEVALPRRYACGTAVLELVLGDITEQPLDAIVNAANAGLRGGSGVDGAIHRVGGASIMAECREIGGCPTGSAVVTDAGDLPCRWVIHAVGPIWRGGEYDEHDLLAGAYRASLQRAREIGASSVAFPSLSTGAYGYPLTHAAPLAVRTVATVLAAGGPELARFVLFDERTFAAYRIAADAQLELL